MIELKNICKYYNPGEVTQKCVFNDFSLMVDDHSFVSIVGSNGSGKTTFLNLICGSIIPDSGEIILDGENITHTAEYKRMKKIGRVFQNPALGTCPNMNILENMALAHNKNKPYNLSNLIDKYRVDYYIDLVKTLDLGLENRLDIPVGKLSGGQRQAIAMLMCTINPIDFLILDEHTAALDPKTADIIMNLTQKIIEEKKLTSLMVTHNLKYALEYGDRIVMLHEGEIVFDKRHEDKKNTPLEKLLDKFTSISIECGN